jgi:hypothetical protein
VKSPNLDPACITSKPQDRLFAGARAPFEVLDSASEISHFIGCAWSFPPHAPIPPTRASMSSNLDRLGGVDVSHRTQEGDLGRNMREALPKGSGYFSFLAQTESA